jgi:uncharacterized membrane protein YhaH (DUF805 family)
MTVRLALSLVAATVAFLVGLTMAPPFWFFGLVFFWPALHMVGVRLIDEGREAKSFSPSFVLALRTRRAMRSVHADPDL